MEFRVPAKFFRKDHGLLNIYPKVNVYIEAEFVDRRSGGWVYEAEVDNIPSKFYNTKYYTNIPGRIQIEATAWIVCSPLVWRRLRLL